MTKIKICGLCRSEDVACVNAARPDYAGFVIGYPQSRRSVDVGTLKKLRARLTGGITAVGVFVDARPDLVAELLNGGIIDTAQLHGGEDGGYIAALRGLTGKTIIKAFVISGGITPGVAAEINACPADLVLLDGGKGGGKRFDYAGLGLVTRPYFIAGGITPENAGEILRKTSPFGLDVSSGVETDGHKDYEKIKRVVIAARGEE